MRVWIFVLAALAAAHTVAAQPAAPMLTPLETAVACGPPPTLSMPSDPLRIVGAQDTMRRVIFNTSDNLIIGGGTEKGVALDQQYFVRRPILTGMDRAHPKGLLTLGWVRVVALDAKTAIAKFEHFCGGVFEGDYLEPFVAPSLPAALEHESPGPAGELDFGTLNRVISGPANMTAGGVGSLMLIDRGTDHDTKAGMRFAVYRDIHSSGVPLAAVGEGVVLAVGETMALTRITQSRDAIVAGDFVVPRK